MRRLLASAALLLSLQGVACAQASNYGSTPALAANLIVKATPGLLWGIDVGADATLSGAAWWVMVYDAVAAPADGAVTPAKCYPVPSGTTSYALSLNSPINFKVGMVIGVSTTGCFNKTASTHAFISGDFQ